MNDKLKEVFGQIQAEETLKDNTKAFLARKTRGYTKTWTIKQPYQIFAVASLCLFLILTGVSWLYFTPTAEISIDINPSLELCVNRFDRVISITGFNDDGRELSHALDIKHENYADAMEQILGNDTIAGLLSNDEVITIAITGLDGIQSAKILSEVESCTAEQRNAYCYFVSSDETIAAHKMGLSYGKYRAFLELQMFDPDITAETVQGMTMREIRDLIDNLSDDEEEESPNGGEYGHHRFCGGYGNRQKTGRKRCVSNE